MMMTNVVCVCFDLLWRFHLILALSTFVVLAYVRCGALHYVDIGLLNEEE